MTDILSLPLPKYCTSQRFNLFVSTRNTKAPILGNDLLEACKGTTVNPFVLGCIAFVFTNDFRATEVVLKFDYFKTGSENTTRAFCLRGGAISASAHKTLDAWPGLTPDDALKIRELYAKYVRFCEVIDGIPEVETPAPAKPTPVPVPAPEPVPVPVEPPKPPTSPSGFWSFIRTLAGVLGALNAVMFLLRIWLPGPVVTVLQAVIKFIVDLAAAHPAQAAAIIVSSAVASHAFALKTAVPRVWQRIDKNPN